MNRIKLSLPAASTALVLVAGGFVGHAVQAEAAASPAASGPVHSPHVSLHGHHAAPQNALATVPASTAAADGRAQSAARTPEEALKLLGERIVAKDVDGIIALHEPEAAIVDYDGSVIRGHEQIRAFYVEWFKSDPVLTVNPRQTVVAGGDRRGSSGKVHHRTASVMGDYSLEQNAPDGTRESFSGNFCDIVQEQADGTWLYVNDNPYPPHGDAAAQAQHH